MKKIGLALVLATGLFLFGVMISLLMDGAVALIGLVWPESESAVRAVCLLLLIFFSAWYLASSLIKSWRGRE